MPDAKAPRSLLRARDTVRACFAPSQCDLSCVANCNYACFCDMPKVQSSAMSSLPRTLPPRGCAAPTHRGDPRMHRGLKISVVIPCYNEESGIRSVIEAMPGYVDEIVVVDNNS